jgi:tyrosyl-tRNA synthetase
MRIFTFIPKEEVIALEEEHSKAPELRILQKAIAKDLTIRVHSEQDYINSVEASKILFGQSTTEQLQSIDEKLFLEIMDGVPQPQISKSELREGINLVEFLSDKTNIFPSRGEARKMIVSGGISINKTKISDPAQSTKDFELLNGKYLLVQKGKKNYYLIISTYRPMPRNG